MSLVAKLDLIQYSISYDLDGGDADNPSTYNVETETFTLNNPTKEGYTFAGWTGSNGSSLQTRVTIEKGSTENKSYVAHYSANEDTAYKVNHKYRKLDGSFETEIEELSGPTGETVYPAVKSKYGFKDPTVQELLILPDGSASIDYEYEREEYSLTIQNSEYVETEFTEDSYLYETMITLAAKDREHYDFVKWSNDNTDNPIIFSLTEDTTIGPIYQAKQYTVSFDAQGGVDVDSITKDYNTEIGNLPESTKVDYAFNGWWTQTSGGEKITSETLVTGNVTYYAHWLRSLSSATVVPISMDMIRGDVATIILEGVEEGYTFTSNDTDVVTVSDSGEVTAVGKGSTTITIEGKLSHETKTVTVTVSPIMYEIKYDAQGGTSVSNAYKEENTEHGALPQTTKTDYIFDGWWTQASGGTLLEANTLITESKTYYAHWSKSMSLAQVSPDSITLTRLQSQTITVTNVDEEYIFISSNENIATVNDGGVVTGVAKGSTTITIEGKTSHATKTVTVTVNPIVYTVIFDAQGGSNGTTVDKEENTAIGSLSESTKEGYIFAGWWTQTSGGEQITEETLVTGEKTYYAHWLKSMSLAQVSPDSITITRLQSQTITVTNVDEEYTFTSNNENIATVNDGGVVTGVTKGSTTITIEGKTSHATKTVTVTVNPIVYTVSFDSQGAGDIADRSVEENTAVGELPTPEKEHSSFDGWYTDTNWGTEVTASTIVSGNVTYYAKWIEDSMKTVFYIPGSCTFNGSKTLSQVGNITSSSSLGCVSTINPSGSDIDYTNVKYIDSQISLFSSANYGRDFELGFTIDGYVADNTLHNQATIVNSKLENSSEYYPGFVIRRKDSGNKVELTEKFGSDTAYSNLFTYEEGTQIRIARIDGKMYYAQDDSDWTLLQDINSYNKRFNLTTWFGAYSNESSMSATGAASSADRYFKGTLSNIYIKLENVNIYTVTFDAHEGTSSFSSKEVSDGGRIGELPSASKEGYSFAGWFTEPSDGRKINETETITGNVTFHAQYVEQHTVTFDGNGGTPSFASKVVGHGLAIGELPTATLEGYALEGWYTDNTWSTQVTESTIINNNETLIAKWRVADVVAKIGNSEFETFEAAVEAVPTTGEKTTIKVLEDIALTETVIIPATKNIELDLQSYTISNSEVLMFENSGTLHIKNGTLLSTAPESVHGFVITNKRYANLNITGGFLHATGTNVMENAGTVTITGGRIEANSQSAAINNNQYGVLNISGGQIIATGTTKGQAIYNNKGTLTISGDVYIENKSQASSGTGRAAVHNNDGTVTILGGTIVSKANSAVKNNATMVIGSNEDPLDITSPVFQGSIYGLEHVSGKNTTIYDGIFKGKTSGINSTTGITHDSNVDFNTTGTETIDTDTYHTAYLE